MQLIDLNIDTILEQYLSEGISCKTAVKPIIEAIGEKMEEQREISTSTSSARKRGRCSVCHGKDNKHFQKYVTPKTLCVKKKTFQNVENNRVHQMCFCLIKVCSFLKTRTFLRHN